MTSNLLLVVPLTKAWSPEAREAAAEARKERVTHYVTRLKQHEGNNEEFDRTVAELKADKQVGLEHLREIHHGYVGFESRKEKSHLLGNIVSHQAVKARQVGRAANIDRWAGKTW